MKINQQPGVKIQQQEQPLKLQRKAAGAADENNGGVVLNVSQRQAAGPPSVDGKAFDAEAFTGIKNMISDDPASAVKAQSNSTPERVLQLLK